MKIKNASATVWNNPGGAAAIVRVNLDEYINLPELPANGRDEAVLKRREALSKEVERRIEAALKGLSV